MARRDLEMILVNLKKLRADKLLIHGTPNHFGSVRFSSDELKEILNKLSSVAYASMQAPTDEELRGRGPSAPDIHRKELLTNAGADLNIYDDDDCPWWCRAICRNRDEWSLCALARDSADADVWYMFMHATQDKHTCKFLELRRQAVIMHDPCTLR